MKTYICVVLVGVLVLCAARPQPKEMTRGQYPHFLSRLVNRNLHHQHRQVATFNCKELSAAAGAFLREVFNIMPNLIPTNPSPTILSDVVEFYYGFDFVNDHAARDAFYCAITPATSVSDLKERLDSQNEYNYNLARIGYDGLLVFGISDLVAAANTIPQVSFLNALGLFSLDPEGTDFLRSLLPPGMHDVVPYVYATNENLDDKCSVLQAMLQQLFQGLDAAPQGMMIRESIYKMTGIRTSETDRINKLVCDLLGASTGGLKQMYDVLDERGIILHFYKTTLYPAIVQMVKWQNFQKFVVMLEQTSSANNIGGQYPNYGEQYPNYGEQYPNYGEQYPNYGEQYPNYGEQYPNYGGGPPDGPGMPGPHGPPAAQPQIMALALEYIQQVEASGILDLQ